MITTAGDDIMGAWYTEMPNYLLFYTSIAYIVVHLNVIWIFW